MATEAFSSSLLDAPGSAESPLDDDAPLRASLIARLNIYFASLSCLGGVALGAGTNTESLSVMAVFFSVLGFVCVDWLKLFALPPVAAYAAMGLAAIYCVSDFIDLNDAGSRQITAVAQLLVFVQAILMLQVKTVRIYEQLGVFCLLQLIVAAVFNNAIFYGLALLPVAITGAWALGLMSSLASSDLLTANVNDIRRHFDIPDDLDDSFESMSVDSDAIADQLPMDERLRQSVLSWFNRHRESDSASKSSIEASIRPAAMGTIESDAQDAAHSVAVVARRVPRIALLAIAPAVTLVGLMFFYALPRTSDAVRATGSGPALVGFSENVVLGQIGQMMLSNQIALRVELTDESTRLPLEVQGGLYLRGRTLERYYMGSKDDNAKQSAGWGVKALSSTYDQSVLPDEFVPSRKSDSNFFARASAKVTCESMRSSSLFAIAPYYRIDASAKAIAHSQDRWTLARRDRDPGVWSFPRMSYRFGTHAFRRGSQSDLTCRWTMVDQLNKTMARKGLRAEDVGDRSGFDDANIGPAANLDYRLTKAQLELERYNDVLLQYDPDRFPTTQTLSDSLVSRIEGERTAFKIAKRFENHLARAGNFQYTLNLDAEPISGMDPIEQFLAYDRRGHCQFFASALVMMLRSQGIPARMVVGYRTMEYSKLAHQFIARQSHAHAWVEALIDREDLPEAVSVYGQPVTEQYWLRLDPTPGGIPDSDANVGQVFDYAQNLWDDYVVEMDRSRQRAGLAGEGTINPISDSYGRFIARLESFVTKLATGEIGGGELAADERFSIPAAAAAIAGMLGLAVVLQIKLPAWIRRRRTDDFADAQLQPKIPFYAEVLSLLAQLGIDRKPTQTPHELAGHAAAQLPQSTSAEFSGPLNVLTQAFYRLRFGLTSAQDSSSAQPAGSTSQTSDLPPPESGEINQALVRLRRFVNSRLPSSGKTE
ncbi:MAG: transglutaminaseTgpA domain-containing protein [Planctomycetota bacterium]